MHTIVKLDKVYNTFLEFVQVKNIKGPIATKIGSEVVYLDKQVFNAS